MRNNTFFKKTTFLFLLLPLFAVAQTSYSEAEQYFKQEKFTQAKPIFETYLKQNSKDKKTLEYLGDIAVHKGEWDDAILYYKALVQEEDSNANYHYKYGAALGMKATTVNKFSASTYLGDIRRELELAAKLDPKHIETRWALIEYYIQLPGIMGGSEKKALEYANELKAISEVDGYLANGHIAEYSKRYKEAEQFYIKAVQGGGSPHTYKKLFSLYEKINEPSKAIDTASKSLKKHRNNELNYQIGRIAAENKIHSEYAIECLNQYITNYSKKDKLPKAWAYYRLAQIYKNLGEKGTALSWIDKALSTKQDFPEARKEKSLILSL